MASGHPTRTLETLKLNIEHIGICVAAPISMGEWYRDNLGFKIILCAGDNESCFLGRE